MRQMRRSSTRLLEEVAGSPHASRHPDKSRRSSFWRSKQKAGFAAFAGMTMANDDFPLPPAGKCQGVGVPAPSASSARCRSDDMRHGGIAGELLLDHVEQDDLVRTRHEIRIVVIGEDHLHRVMHLAENIVERLLRFLRWFVGHRTPRFARPPTQARW
jgi:hypothetical protein